MFVQCHSLVRTVLGEQLDVTALPAIVVEHPHSGGRATQGLENPGQETDFPFEQPLRANCAGTGQGQTLTVR